LTAGCLSRIARVDAPPRPARAAALLAGLPALALALAGCGGGSSLAAGESSASFDVKVVRARFPSRQAIAKPAVMELAVRNTGSHTVPNLAITVDSFSYTSDYPELAANKRPIWAIEQGPGANAKPPVQTQEVSQPGGGQTAYLNTWALGPLAAGHTQTFVWKVIPVKAGSHVVSYGVSAGLAGKARARLASGGPAGGRFTVQIAGAPPNTHVDPTTGKVVAGSYPSASSSR
jgi:hypothetical protein